jgi:hypothetical protein
MRFTDFCMAGSAPRPAKLCSPVRIRIVSDSAEAWRRKAGIEIALQRDSAAQGSSSGT